MVMKASVSGLYFSSLLHFTFNPVAPLLRFSALPEADQRQTVMAGSPADFNCELSNTTGQATWYKEGTKLPPQIGVDLQSEGNLQEIVVPSAEQAHTGIYHCGSKDADIQFAVELKGDSQQLCSTSALLHCKLTTIADDCHLSADFLQFSF